MSAEGSQLVRDANDPMKIRAPKDQLEALLGGRDSQTQSAIYCRMANASNPTIPWTDSLGSPVVVRKA